MSSFATEQNHSRFGRFPFLVILVLTAFCFGFSVQSSVQKTVGVLTLRVDPLARLLRRKARQELAVKGHRNFKHFIQNSSYIAQGYVDWLQSADLNVVPLDIHAEDDILLSELEKFDGLLLTGGRQPFYKKIKYRRKKSHQNRHLADNYDLESKLSKSKIPDEYLKKVKKIMERVKQINNTKRGFPIWGTCLGFEAMLITESNYTLTRHLIDNELHKPTPITIYNPTSYSIRFFSHSEQSLFEDENLFYFNHKFGFWLSDVKNHHLLSKTIRPVATITKEGKDFLVWFEYKDFPFIGSQFHPEKFEKKTYSDSNKIRQHQKTINSKLVLLFKAMMNRSSDYLKHQFADDEFEVEQNTSHFDLYDVGMYNHINLYVRTPNQISTFK